MKFSTEKIVEVLIADGKCKQEEKDIIVYGLKMGVEIAFNIFTTIVLALLFGLILETIIFTLVFFFLRSYAGGVHARNGLECYFFSTIMLVAVLSVQKFGIWNAGFNELAFYIGLLIILLIAPLGDKNKPLDEVEKKHYRKKVYHILAVIVLVYAISSMFKVGIITTNISLAILVVSVSLILGKIKNSLNERG